MPSERESSISTLIETVQRLRAEQFRHIPGNLISSIISLEIENEENPEAALRGIEQLVTDSATSKSARGGS